MNYLNLFAGLLNNLCCPVWWAFAMLTFCLLLYVFWQYIKYNPLRFNTTTIYVFFFCAPPFHYLFCYFHSILSPFCWQLWTHVLCVCKGTNKYSSDTTHHSLRIHIYVYVCLKLYMRRIYSDIYLTVYIYLLHHNNRKRVEEDEYLWFNVCHLVSC